VVSTNVVDTSAAKSENCSQDAGHIYDRLGKHTKFCSELIIVYKFPVRLHQQTFSGRERESW
jgi:hypothetical protein